MFAKNDMQSPFAKLAPLSQDVGTLKRFSIMRVGIDAREIRLELGGIGRYALNLLLGLSFEPSDLEFTVFYNDPSARKIVDRYGGPYRGRFQWVRARVTT